VLDEYFPCHPNTALLTCICILAGPFLSSFIGLLTATSLLSFFSFVNPTLWFKYCPQQAAPGLILLVANPACVTLSVSEAYSRCTSGCLRRPSFQYAASAAGAASSTLPPFPILHHSSANVCTPWALAFQLRLAPERAIAKLSLPSLPFLFLQIVS
jgi:hypothetical protein